jgi:hypothetical protein
MDERSGLRTPVTRGQLLGVLIAVGVLLGGSSAWAGDTPTFPDVPDDHPFHDEVEWLAQVEVTGGFPDGTYRPNQPVTRGSMAAFMQRLFDVQEGLSVVTGDNPAGTSSTTFTPLPDAELGIDVPEGTDAYVIARFTAESSCYGLGYCRVRLMIDKEDDGTYVEMLPAEGGDYGFDSTDNGTETSSSWESHSVERYATVSGGCSCSVIVERSTSSASGTFETDDWILVTETDLLTSDSGFIS